MLKRKFKQAFKQIKTSKKILLVTHSRPDGDAVSSICSMMLFLEKMGIEYRSFSTDEAPPSLDFLPRSERIETDISDYDFSGFDLIIPLDCGSLKRTNLEKEIGSRKKNQKIIEFDHHKKVDDYADLEIRVDTLSSTAELLFHFFKTNRVRIDKQMANCLLTGIMTDTGNFLYSSTTEKTVKVASELLLLGAKYPQIIEETWRNKSVNVMKLWGRAMSNLKINDKYNFAVSVLSSEDIKKCGCHSFQLEGIPGFLSNLKGVNGLLLLVEQDDGLLKGSLRTEKNNLDMSILAGYLGGGGHKKASAFRLEAKLKLEKNRWQAL